MPCRRSTGNSSRITPRSRRAQAKESRVAVPLPSPRRRTMCSSGMYPAQARTLDTTYFNYLADKGLDGDPGHPRRTAGRRAYSSAAAREPESAAAAVCRAEPASASWRPTPSFLGNPPAPAPFSPMATPWMADFDPFTLTSPTRFRAPPPPALTSDRYTRDYNEVREFGSSRQRQAHGRTNRSRVFLRAKPRRCCGTARCAGSPRDICARAATPRGCSRWRISRPPMRSSRAGTARRTTPSGGRSRRSRRAMPTAIRRPSAIRRGNR